MKAAELYRILSALDRDVDVVIACEDEPGKGHPVASIQIGTGGEPAAPVLLVVPLPHAPAIAPVAPGPRPS